jgi:hypothetical protein
MTTHVYDVVHLVTQLKSLMKGFGSTQQPTKTEIPDSGDQIVLRLSREKFKGSAQVN